MNSGSFDRLARSIAGTASRRTALAGIAAALTRLLAPHPAGAQPSPSCRPFGGRCVPSRGIDCCAGTVCRDGHCLCPRGRRRCQDRCIPAKRCCGTKCSGGAVCRNDRCVCLEGRKRCQGRCIPRGQCCHDRECGPGGACTAGQCRCRPGFRPCQGGCIRADACCPACASGQACQAGRCTCTGESCPGCCAEDTCHTESTAAHCQGPEPACEVCGAEEVCGEPACGCVPDSASCLASGTLCGGPGQPPCGDCCSSGVFVCNPGQNCCGPSLPGDTCGPGVSCDGEGTTTACQCNRCCLQGGLPPSAFGGTCATTCCSGQCDPNNPMLCA